MVKSLEGFCFKATSSVLQVKFVSLWSNRIQSPARLQRIMRKALLLLQFFKVLWLFSTYLIIRSYCFGKETGKSLQFLDLP